MAYWKSAPYLMHFMHGYRFNDRLEETRVLSPGQLMPVLNEHKAAFLKAEKAELMLVPFLLDGTVGNLGIENAHSAPPRVNPNTGSMPKPTPNAIELLPFHDLKAPLMHQLVDKIVLESKTGC